MASSSKKNIQIEEVVRSLVALSFSRDGLNQTLDGLPSDSAINTATLEYEFNLLKIISAGWGISFFMAEGNCKKAVSEMYWSQIYEISRNISDITSASLGRKVEYFEILRNRINMYATALSALRLDDDPAGVIGENFARLCGNEKDAHAVSCGQKAFSDSIACVKSYLDSIEMV
jgi:hypothetical protein